MSTRSGRRSGCGRKRIYDNNGTKLKHKVGIEDIEGFACGIVISIIRPRLTSILLGIDI